MIYLKIAVVVAAFFAGWQINDWRIGYQIADAERQRAIDTLEIERLNKDNANAVAARYAAEKAVQRAREKVITKEVIKYVQSPNSGQCVLSDDWVRIVNDSARVSAPTGPAGGANDAAEGAATDSDALISITENYSVCRANASQLKALQEWVRGLSDEL